MRGKGQPGVLSASVSNTSGTAERIAFAAQDAQPVFAEAKAYAQERLSGATQVQMPAVPAAPGDVVTLTVQSANAPAVVVVVPVLPPSGPYATMAPTGAPTAATPTTPAPTATETPSATATTTG